MGKLDDIYRSVVEMFASRPVPPNQLDMEVRKARAIADKDKQKSFATLPYAFRFSCKPLSSRELEIEIFDTNEERQGRIYDMEFERVYPWLRSSGVERTLAIERAIDSAFNFGESVYFPEDDTMIIPNETDHLSALKQEDNP